MPRNLIWKSFRKKATSKQRNSIKEIYETTRNFVGKDNAPFKEFITKVGLRQGCVLSPLLIFNGNG